MVNHNSWLRTFTFFGSYYIRCQNWKIGCTINRICFSWNINITFNAFIFWIRSKNFTKYSSWNCYRIVNVYKLMFHFIRNLIIFTFNIRKGKKLYYYLDCYYNCYHFYILVYIIFIKNENNNFIKLINIDWVMKMKLCIL